MSNKYFNYVESEYGGWTIEKARIVRQPLKGGSFIKHLSRVPLDEDLYHVALEFSARNPLTQELKVFAMEKGPSLHAQIDLPGGVQNVRPKGSHGMNVEIPEHMKGKLTIGSMLEKSREAHLAAGKDINYYSLTDANCQNFVKYSLEASGIVLDEDQKRFTWQNAKKLTPGWGKPVAQAFTNTLAAWGKFSERNFQAPEALRKNHVRTNIYPAHQPSAEARLATSEVKQIAQQTGYLV